jgi:hypothetical protein
MSSKSTLRRVLLAAIPKMVAGITKHYSGQSFRLNGSR